MSGARLTADSTCGDYLSAPADERQAAAIGISTDLPTYGAGRPLWGTSLDAECGNTPDTTLRTFVAAQLVLAMPSVSMQNTIDTGDMVLVNTLAFIHRAPRRGEMVAFMAAPDWATDPAQDRFVKRVIGSGGDHVACCDPRQRLIVNGHPLDESYLYRDGGGHVDVPSTAPFDIVVPAGRLWMLGDHRSRSGDSLTHLMASGDVVQATVAVDTVVGRAYLVIDSHDQAKTRPLPVPSTYADVPAPSPR